MNNVIIIEDYTNLFLLKGILLSIFLSMLLYNFVRLFQTINRDYMLETAQDMIFAGRRRSTNAKSGVTLADNSLLDSNLVDEQIEKTSKRLGKKSRKKTKESRDEERTIRHKNRDKRKIDKQIKSVTKDMPVEDKQKELMQTIWETEDVYENAREHFVYMDMGNKPKAKKTKKKSKNTKRDKKGRR